MCLSFRFGRKGKPQPIEATPTPSPGAADPGKATANKPISPKPAVTATPSDSPPQVEQQPQVPAVPNSLPSQVDETLAECPRWARNR